MYFFKTGCQWQETGSRLPYGCKGLCNVAFLMVWIFLTPRPWVSLNVLTDLNLFHLALINIPLPFYLACFPSSAPDRLCSLYQASQDFPSDNHISWFPTVDSRLRLCLLPARSFAWSTTDYPCTDPLWPLYLLHAGLFAWLYWFPV